MPEVSKTPDSEKPAGAPANEAGNGQAFRIPSREEILEADDIREEMVGTPEWGEGAGVRVRAYSRRLQRRITDRATVDGEVDPDKLEMLMFVHGVVEPVFEEQDIELLLDKSTAPLRRVLDTLLRINGLTAEEVKAEKAQFPEEPGA